MSAPPPVWTTTESSLAPLDQVWNACAMMWGGLTWRSKESVEACHKSSAIIQCRHAKRLSQLISVLKNIQATLRTPAVCHSRCTRVTRLNPHTQNFWMACHTVTKRIRNNSSTSDRRLVDLSAWHLAKESSADVSIGRLPSQQILERSPVIFDLHLVKQIYRLYELCIRIWYTYMIIKIQIRVSWQ